MAPECFAHTKEGRPPEEWQPLDRHLRSVGSLAREFAAAFGSGAWGELAGLWHDLGKYAPDFQAYLREASNLLSVVDASVEDARPGRIDHSSAGAIHAHRLGRRVPHGLRRLAIRGDGAVRLNCAGRRVCLSLSGNGCEES